MENNEQLKSATIKSLFWKLFERFGAQLIQFVVNIVLARILMPEDYGAIALIIVFIAVSNVFTQTGFSSALIRKLDADELDYSSVFWSSLFVSILIYIVLFFTAPFIADFYELPILKNVLRVLSLTVIVGTYNSVQNAILSKKLMFKKLFISSFSSVLVSGIIGIVCAYCGLGVWALCAQQLSAIVITTIVMSFTVKWHPKFIFSFKRVKFLLSFGWKLLFSSLLDTIYNNLYSLIIGKQYSSDDLAYWNRGKQFPDLIVGNINGSIGSVMYPVYSMKQNNIVELKQLVRRSIKVSAYLVFPLMVGLAIVAEPLVKLLLTDKWLFCVPFLQAWCIIYAFMPIHTTNLQVYNALGRSDIFLWLEIIKKIIGVIVLFATLPYGLEVMIYAKIGTSIVSTFINAYPNTKVLKYSIKEQFLDLFPMMIMSAIMGGIVYATSLIPIHYIAAMVIEILVGIIIYLLLSMVFKPEAYLYCKNILVNLFKKLKNNKINKHQQNNLENKDITSQNSSVDIDTEEISKSEEDIQKSMEHYMKNDIKVSVLCLAYNHEKYIRECLEGFVNQKTNFKYEVLINDDCSTDKTASIIKEYEEKYPEIIKPIYQKENQYSKGNGIIRPILLPKVQGEYIALCEGDDAWIDYNKLQMQVDYLDNHLDCYCVSTAFTMHNCLYNTDQLVSRSDKDRDFTLKEIVDGGGGLFATASLLYRKEVDLNMPECFFSKRFGDYQKPIYAAILGKVHYLNKCTARYNHYTENSYSKKNLFIDDPQYYREIINLLSNVNQFYDYKYNDAFIDTIGIQNIYLLFAEQKFKQIKQDEYYINNQDKFYKIFRLKVKIGCLSPKLLDNITKIARKIRRVK